MKILRRSALFGCICAALYGLLIEGDFLHPNMVSVAVLIAVLYSAAALCLKLFHASKNRDALIQTALGDGETESHTVEDYETLRHKIFEDPSVSHWVKVATSQLENRDPLDAQNDVAVLAHLTALRSKEALM